MLRILSALVAAPTGVVLAADTAGNAGVKCGSHTASSCAQCPQGNGEAWCHGDCVWRENRCRLKTDVYCGNHWASSCGECPQGQGAAWCNGDCTWRGSACILLTDVGKKRKDPVLFPYPPEVRPRGCRETHYGKDQMGGLPVSIVVPWLDEDFEHVRDMLLSVMAFTPAWLIQEIIFVARGTKPREHELLAISEKVKVKFVTRLEAPGSSAAKNIGVKAASFPAIAFLSPDSRVNRDWLQPLVRQLALDARTVAIPVVDIIPVGDWRKHKKGSHSYWRFEWNLELTTGNPGGAIEESSETFSSPAAPPLMVARKDWLTHLGLFSSDLRSSRGDPEQFDLSMKVWRAGGSIKVVPCSRVSWQREVLEDLANVTDLLRDRRLLAESWLDGEVQQFYQALPEARELPALQASALQGRIKDRQRLNCKNMSWYLEMVDHELWWEQDRTCSPKGDLPCSAELAPQRQTIMSSDLMPRDMFVPRRQRAEKILEEEANARAARNAAAAAAKAASAGDSAKGSETCSAEGDGTCRADAAASSAKP